LPGWRARCGRHRRAVSVTGDFDFWNERAHPMRCSGPAECGVVPPEAKVGTATSSRSCRRTATPHQGRSRPAATVPPRTASVVDVDARERLAVDDPPSGSHPWNEPVSIYEVHLGSQPGRASLLQLGRAADYAPIRVHARSSCR
jgi:1,4-alpha-glucan branching enzyme